jgi:hypothetical protein
VRPLPVQEIRRAGAARRQVKTIADFASDKVEAGVGRALQDDAGRYLFFLAGTRHRYQPEEPFYFILLARPWHCRTYYAMT